MRKILVGAVALLLLTQSAWAARIPIHDAAESAEYGRKFGGMIVRGLLNVTTSFVDLLVNVVNETRDGPPVVGTLVGVGKGTGCATLRALSGGVDLLTFWVPGFNGFPVSDSYENCLAIAPIQSQGPILGSSAVGESALDERTPEVSVPAPAPPREEKRLYVK